MTEFVLYAVYVGEPDWAEVIITSTTSESLLENAKEWAVANGYDRLRVWEFEGDAPNFSDPNLINL